MVWAMHGPSGEWVCFPNILTVYPVALVSPNKGKDQAEKPSAFLPLALAKLTLKLLPLGQLLLGREATRWRLFSRYTLPSSTTALPLRMTSSDVYAVFSAGHHIT